eukprot:3356893-Pyramimonas_sp.AAC.1
MCKSRAEYHGDPSLNCVFPAIQGCQGATVALIRGIGIPRTAFWHDSECQDATVSLTRGVEVLRM